MLSAAWIGGWAVGWAGVGSVICSRDSSQQANGTADSATITTPNKLSPQRCVVTLTATGRTDPDPDPTNNRTRLTVDLVDRNDGP